MTFTKGQAHDCAVFLMSVPDVYMDEDLRRVTTDPLPGGAMFPDPLARTDMIAKWVLKNPYRTLELCSQSQMVQAIAAEEKKQALKG